MGGATVFSTLGNNTCKEKRALAGNSTRDNNKTCEDEKVRVAHDCVQ
jgi:hypothetical protein